MISKKAIINIFIYTVLPKLPIIVSIIVLPIISPYLTLEDYGKFGIITAYYSICSLLLTLGQNIVLQNSFFEYKSNYKLVWREAYGIMQYGGAFSSILFVLAVFFTMFSKMGNYEFFWVAGALGFSLICSPIETISQTYYILNRQALPIAYRSIIIGVVNAILLILTVKVFKMGYLGWVISLSVSTVFSLLFYLYPVLYKNNIYPVLTIKKRRLNRYLKIGLPLLPHNLSLFIFNTSDRLLLGWFNVPVSQIGLYSQGYILGSNGMVVVTGIFSGLARDLQELFREKSQQNAQKLIKILCLLIFGLAFLFFNIGIWMKEIYLLLFNNSSLEIGYHVPIIILSSYMFYPLYMFAVYPLSIKGESKLISYISLSAALINLILNILLIPLIGYWAALLSTYISYMLLGMGGLLHPKIRINLSWISVSIVKIYIYLFLYVIWVSVLVYFLKDILVEFKILAFIISIVITTFLSWIVLSKLKSKTVLKVNKKPLS